MMKKMLFFVLLSMAGVCMAEPFRVALMDFDDQTGMKPDEMLGGAILPGALAAKGVNLLGKDLLNQEAFTLVDRRDFLSQMEKMRPTDSGKATPTRPSFIQAAQALGADVVIRGSLQSFSSGKNVVNLGGNKTEFAILSLRVSLEALDAVDGSVIAMADGVASEKIRQTEQNYTALSEEDAIGLMEKSIAQAIPDLKSSLDKRQAKLEARPKVKLSVKSNADPALVEIDGILVGSTPIENLEIYTGDHVFVVGKPGYRDITKRIMFEKDTTIEVPMMRTELSAEEMKDVLEKIRMNVMVGDPGLVIHTINDGP
ncbi:MAG: PEGA domain-containing protein [Lentisphaerota bacterium]